MISPLELVGVWTLHRRLVDRRAGVHYSVSGTLTLTRAGDDVRWLEAGTLTWGAGRAEVGREYRLVPGASGWSVMFADGRPFHPWTERVEHPCRDDVYRGVIVGDRTRLRTVWDVHGPAKDQRIVTRCVRRAA